MASPPGTWFDCARDLDDETFEAVTEWMLERHTSMPTLRATVRRLAGRGGPASRAPVSRRPAWQRPAGSKLELRVLRALAAAGSTHSATRGRDRGLRRIGWQVERVTDQELTADFRAVIAELLELHALRSQQLEA